MTSPSAAVAFAAKAQRALAAARLLMDKGETEGTCNRAYYAMFYAAHVVMSQLDGAKAVYKTHRGLIADFGRLVVQPDLLDASFGRAFNDIQKLRELSDYLGDPPSIEDAESALAEADAFVAAILDRWSSGSTRDGDLKPAPD